MRSAYRFGWILLVASVSLQIAAAQSTLTDQLRTALIGKTLSLKSACPSNHLTFDASGTLTRGCPPGAWMVYSLFRTTNVKLTDRTLEISGTREVDVVMATDSKSESGFPEADPTILTFQLATPLADLSAGNALVAAAFDSDKDRSGTLGPHGKLLAPEVLPTFAPAPMEMGKKIGSLGRPPASLSPDRASIPKAIFSPDPEYSTAARKAKIRGQVLLSVVVDEQGRPEIIRVERRLGYGLDEEAVIAVSQWKFEPAIKDGNAVAARIAVDIGFNL